MCKTTEIFKDCIGKKTQKYLCEWGLRLIIKITVRAKNDTGIDAFLACLLREKHDKKKGEIP